jgi:hypothetical protein
MYSCAIRIGALAAIFIGEFAGAKDARITIECTASSWKRSTMVSTVDYMAN